MRIVFKITSRLLRTVQADLSRPHKIAAERVGFISGNVASLSDGGLIVLARNYHVVDDADYVDDPTVGAMLGASGFRKALQFAYSERVSMWHVHCHAHRGQPWFGHTDLSENAAFVPDFFHVRPEFPHGALVTSRDGLAGLCWLPGAQTPLRISTLTVVGAPMLFIRNETHETTI